jgi:hypothetical protein
MPAKHSSSRIGIAAAILTALVMFGVILFITNQKYLQNEDNLGAEVFKLSYQFLLITVIGGAVTYLFTRYIKIQDEIIKDREKEETKRGEEKGLQRKFYNDFKKAYNKVKKIRRFLRARARILSKDMGSEETIILKTVRYDEQMQILTKLQLKFEFFRDVVGANPELLKTNDVLGYLKSIESYLNKIVGEYEDTFRNFPNQYYIDEVPTLPIDKLPRLAEFIIKYKKATCFKEQFVEPAKNMAQSLLKLVTSK